MERGLCMLRHGKKRRCNKLQLSCGEKLRHSIFSNVAIYDAICSYIYIYYMSLDIHLPYLPFVWCDIIHSTTLWHVLTRSIAKAATCPNFGNGAVRISKKKQQCDLQ